MPSPNWGDARPCRAVPRAAQVVRLPDASAFEALITRETLLRRRAGAPWAALVLQASLRADLHPLLQQQRVDDLGQWLLRHVRPSDTVALWSGQHFGVLLPGCPAQHAPAVLERLLQVPAGRYWPEDWGLDVELMGRVV